MFGFQYLEDIIQHNRLSTLEMLMEKSPCVISERHPDCIGSDSLDAVKTGLTFAIENKKYDVADLFLKKGASWENDPLVNQKIISLLEKQIAADPDNSAEAQALLKRVQDKNRMCILRFLESPVGTALSALAKESNINLVKELQKSLDFNSGNVCVAQMKDHIKSSAFQAKLTQRTDKWSCLSFYYGAADEGKKEKMDKIISNLDTPMKEILADKFKQIKGDLLAMKEDGAEPKQRSGIKLGGQD